MVLDANLLCCQSGILDDCGVCDGANTICGTGVQFAMDWASQNPSLLENIISSEHPYTVDTAKSEDAAELVLRFLRALLPQSMHSVESDEYASLERVLESSAINVTWIWQNDWYQHDHQYDQDRYLYNETDEYPEAVHFYIQVLLVSCWLPGQVAVPR